MKNEIARLLDKPEDYKRFGVNPDYIEVWEDRRRNTDTGAGNWEWWYFDAIMDDGTKVVVQFFTKSGMKKIKRNGDSPSVTVKITTPDGTLYSEEINVKSSECTYGMKKCDVNIGGNTFVGDFEKYEIHTNPQNGLAVDLHLKSLAKPYRPGSAYFGFGEDEYYTWICSVPKGEVSGTITIKGEKVSVHGSGYHDHQWGNRFYLPEWNHWVWARQSFEDYSLLVFDFVASKEYGYKRFPIIFIQDKNGEIVFESKNDVKCKVLGEYNDDKNSGKDYPVGIQYEFEQDGRKVIYQLREHDILEAKGMKNLPFLAKILAKKLKMNVSYTRYAAHGELSLDTGKEKINRSGELIYEFMYPGESFKGHM